MVEAIGFILMLQTKGMTARYDEVTGSKTGIFENYKDCRKAVDNIYDYSNNLGVSCAVILKRAGSND